MQWLITYPFAAYQVANGGVFKHNSENSESVTKEEVDSLIDKHRNFAQFYTRRFIDFMNFNNEQFLNIIKIKMRTCTLIEMLILQVGL